MFCMKCGKPTDGLKICPECAAKAAAPAATPAADVIQLSTGIQAPKKKKKKTGLIAAIIAAVVLVGAGIGLWLGWDSLFGGDKEEPGEAVKVYDTAEEHMIGVEGEAMERVAGVFTGAYGTLRDSLVPGAENNGSTSEMHILLGEEVQGILEAALAYEGLYMDLDWLSDVMLNISAAQNADLMQVDIGVGLGATKIATLRYLMDTAKSVMYMGLPELSSTYLQMDMLEATGGVSIRDLLTANQEQLAQLQSMLPTEEELQALLVKYIGVALTKITKVDKKVVTISTGGVRQEVTQLTTTISEADLYDIAEKILTFVKDDDKVMGILEKVAALEIGANYKEGVMSEELKRNIDATLEDLRELKLEASDTNYIVLTTCVDARDNVVARSFTIFSEESTEGVEVFSYKQATDGEAFAFEGQFGGGMMKAVGAGTKSGNLQNGTYTLEVQGQKLLNLKVTNLDTQKLDAGNLCGTFLLSPSEDLLEMVLYGTTLPSYMLEEIAIELKLDATEDSESFEIRLLSDAEMMLGLTLATWMEERSISVPTDALNIGTDLEAAQEWVLGLDLDGLLDRLQSAGVPGALTEYLEAALDLLAFYS